MKWLKCHIEPKQLWQLVNEISLFETWKIIESGWESGLEVTIETSGIYRKNTPVFWDLFYFMMSNAQTALCVLCSWCHCRKVLILNYFIPISKSTSHLLLRIKLTQVGSHFFLSTSKKHFDPYVLVEHPSVPENHVSTWTNICLWCQIWWTLFLSTCRNY